MLPYTIAGYAIVLEDRMIYPDGTTTSSLTNNLGESVGSIDQDGNLSRNIYDVARNMVKSIDALGQETSFTYDLLGRNKTRTDALANVTSMTYDLGGRVETTTDVRLKVTTNFYDELGRLWKVNDRLGKNTVRSYDNMNRLEWVEDAELKKTEYVYNSLGQRTMVTLFDTSKTEYEYDGAGRVKLMTMPSGTKRKPVYEPFKGTLDKIEYLDATGTLVDTDDYTYDDFLRPTGSISRYGVAKSQTYTERGQLDIDTTTYSNQPYLVNYDYDNRGRLEKITYPSGREVTYGFDQRSLLDTIAVDGAQIEDRSYNVLGLLTNVDRAHVDEVRTYDDLNRATGIANTNVGDASYGYDANGNKLSESWTGVMGSLELYNSRWQLRWLR